jgi:hypothetical protein
MAIVDRYKRLGGSGGIEYIIEDQYANGKE